MAYTRPASDVANLAWTGLSAYSRPASDAANLSFVQGATHPVVSLGAVSNFGSPAGVWNQFSDASGFAPAQFGAPTNRRTQQVTEGLALAQFGEPIGYKLQRASGFAPVQFGVPYLHPSHVAPWPVSTQIGGVGGNQFWRAPTMAVVARLGTPTTPTNRTGTASGFIAVQIGRPLAARYRPPNTDIICLAEGFKPTILGTPAAQWDQSGQVQAIAPTVQFCAPRAFTTHHAEGLAPSSQLGAPATRTTHRVSGFKPVALGLAGAILTQHATGTAPKARFGAPKTVRSNWYEVRGFCPFRAGTPRGYQRNNRRADGFSPVQFGMAAAFHAHRTTSVPPVARLGKPLLKRITQC